MKFVKKTSWIFFAVMAVAIGLYPGVYFIFDREFGLLGSKEAEILSNVLWNTGFYAHIIFGGLALLTGWPQFSERLRKTRLKLHRNLGKVYVVSAFISSLAAIYISFYATGGLITFLGFFCLGWIWLSTTLKAYFSIKEGVIDSHAKFMIFSFAACFSAVTLRIWLPLLIMWYQDFLPAYRVVSWLCWVPNILAAWLITRMIEKRREALPANTTF